MKFIPILFSTPMVQAIKDGRKKMTRRIVKPQPTKQEAVEIFCKEGPGSVNASDLTQADIEIDELFDKCPYGQPGDILWVRETFQFSLNPNEFVYKSDTDNPIYLDKNWKWKPNIYMPKTVCRIFLKVKSVRVERLQDISEQDAIAEGAPQGIYREGPNVEKGEFQLEYNNHASYKDGFRFIWQTINGRQSWIDNPWVWVIEFERVELTLSQREIFLNEQH